MKRLLVEQKDCPSFSAKKEVSKLLFIILVLIVVFFSARETDKTHGTRLYSSCCHVHKAEKVWERQIYFCKSFFINTSLQTAHVWNCHWIITAISTHAKERFSDALTEVSYELPFLPLCGIGDLEKFTMKILKSSPKLATLMQIPEARCLGCSIMYFGNTKS